MFYSIANPQFTHIYQKASCENGFNVTADHFYMSNISLHVEFPNRTALTINHSSHSYVDTCYFYGGCEGYTVYYSGPNVCTGQPTLDAYYAAQVPTNNVFTNNVIHTKPTCNSLYIALQNNGNFSKNIIRGGKLTIYMCQNTDVNHNIVYDSPSNGISVFLPSNSVNITYNTIYNCSQSSIRVENQQDQGNFTSAAYNLVISYNVIYDAKCKAFEIYNLLTSTLNNNRIIGTDNIGFYLECSNNLTLSNNTISYFVISFSLKNTNCSSITANNIYSVYPSSEQHIVNFCSSVDNTFSANFIYGNDSTDNFYSGDTVCENTTSNNTSNEFYTYNQELSIMKFQFN